MFRIAACFATLAALASAGERQGVPFDGQGAYAVVEEGRRFDADAFSVACWVKPRQAPSAQTLVSRGRASALFTLYLYKNRVRMLVEYTKGQYAHANVPLPKPGAWTHYLGTYDGKAIRLYVNGKLGAEAPAVGRIARSDAPLLFGAVAPGERVLDGWLDDIRFWGRALSADKAAAVAAGQGPTQALLGRWTSDSLNGKTWRNTAVSDTPAVYHDEIGPRKADGYRGIWYSNQPQKNEYVYKYSGGLGTYCAKHIPFAIYAPKVNKTFFCYGGALKDKNELLHMVSYYDHETGTVPRPTIVLNKHTDDAHDNPVIALDAKGHIWIFSSSHGTSRPSYISVSRNPYDINSFERVLTTNFSYTQPWYLEGRGFLFLHTKYMGGRMLHQMTSPDGRTWTKPEPLAKIEMGHYQVSGPYGAKVGTAFNFHPKPKGLNWRTNLYYIETSDFGAKWTNAQGEALDLPLITPNNPALVHDFRAEGRNVYMKDIAFDAKGNPVILFITSKGWQAGPEMGPRTWQTARWTGEAWDIRGTIESDSNYDMGSLLIESDARWRIVGPTQPGPQRYNPGGEVAMWLSADRGRTWEMEKQLTRGSAYNHTYCRKPVKTHPDFIAIWADGHGREPSKSRLYICDDKGNVSRLPPVMQGERARPERVE